MTNNPASVENYNIRHLFYIILIGSFALRLWGIWNVSTSDEYNEVLEALRVCSGHFSYERWIKRFYLYILAGEYAIFYGIGWIFNAFASPMDFAEKIVRNMGALFILGRITSAVAGAWTVALLYKIGNKSFNRQVGVIASLLLTFTAFHVDLSQQAKVDALLGLLVVATFYFIFKLLETNKPNKWDYSWCGFLMALAIQTKINSIVLIVPFAIMILSDYKTVRTRLSYISTFFLPFFILGFILGNPPVVLAPHKFIKSVFGLGTVYTTGGNVVPNDLIGFVAYPIYYFRSMGAVISLITILAILYAAYRSDKKRAILVSFIAAFYILMGASKNLVAPYYMIPVVPAIFLLIGDFIGEMSDKFATKFWPNNSKTSLVFVLILLFALITPVINTVSQLISMSGKNTRFLAKQWIEANIPKNSKILMDSGKSINSFAPPIAENRETMERILTNAKKNVSEGKIAHAMVDKNALVYYELLLKTVPEKSYDITSTMFGLDVKSIDYYLSEQYEYFIISKGMKLARTNTFFSKLHPEIAQFYSALDTDDQVQLIKVIRSSATNRGDTFYIYKLVS